MQLTISYSIDADSPIMPMTNEVLRYCMKTLLKHCPTYFLETGVKCAWCRSGSRARIFCKYFFIDLISDWHIQSRDFT